MRQNALPYAPGKLAPAGGHTHNQLHDTLCWTQTAQEGLLLSIQQEKPLLRKELFSITCGRTS
ncbi:hypothetical protein EDM52_21795 [Brevibacillus invocatus]|uniref:Uncharacterized protein n=1 Tax=Brevibacillus invocatus TaxID=173959 RepID=A0A3M8BWS7_9BACL|nr:hypothetical protein EDM52_21795 [Brevibacillus invocatus]